MQRKRRAAADGNACSADMERFGITAWGQTREWLLFLAVGAALGVWYDLFRIGRLFGSPTAWRVFWQDIAAAAGAAFLTVTAALPISNGQVRPLHLLAAALGAAAYYLTVGRLLYGILRWTARRCRRVGEKWENFKRKCKIRQKSFKKHLKPTDDV
ncbi:MAG: hypothetical protein E7549_08695 [Ruminococcaceae bacterium]|nr:hypothetical protein [Oscillospiraceae bacterium]